jgi:hypothetical protein
MHGYCSSNCLCTQHLLQCQSQLKRLYAEGIKGCYFEFSAYNLLCVMLHSNNKRDLLSSLARLSKQAKQDEAVKHALAVHSAVSSGNYVLFFKLYKQAPNLNSCLMGKGLNTICINSMCFCIWLKNLFCIHEKIDVC